MAPLLELEHLFDAKQGFSRPYEEGRQAVKNLVVVGIKNRKEEQVEIEALCVRTTKIHDPPVTITVVFDKNATEIPKRISSISCGCKSGASKEHVCKHAMACLIYLERNDENDIEALTCTDIQQRWDKLKDTTLQKFEPAPLEEFCHLPPKNKNIYKRKVEEVTPEIASELRSLYISAQPHSEASVFLSCCRVPEIILPVLAQPADSGTSNSQKLRSYLEMVLLNPHYLIQRAKEISDKLLSECSPAEQDFYNKFVKISFHEIIDACVETLGQDNEKWADFKRGRISGSFCYSLFTYFKNSKADWGKKLKTIFLSSFTGNKNTERGLMYEGDARDCYIRCENQRSSGIETKMLLVGFLISHLLPWLGFSADAIVFQGEDASSVWECKTPAAGENISAAEILKHVKFVDEKTLKLRQKHPYYGQIQLGMLLYNLPSCEFTVYCCKSDEVCVQSIVLNETFCRDLLEVLAKVFFKKILPWRLKNSV